MNRPTDILESIADQIRLILAAKDAARERALPLCREAIRHCSHAIRAVHRHEFDLVRELLQSARSDLTLVMRQQDLESRLEKSERKSLPD